MSAIPNLPLAAPVLRFAECEKGRIETVLSRYGVECAMLPADTAIPGSHWGDSEAGLVGRTLYLRADTPAHSVLHEACHFICMDDARRESLDRDAGGDDAEENGVCYLQILLADEFPEFGRERMLQDMDSWGYSFRLGSARAWFESDAEDARAWLLSHGVIDVDERVTGERRR